MTSWKLGLVGQHYPAERSNTHHINKASIAGMRRAIELAVINMQDPALLLHEPIIDKFLQDCL